ncbi:protein cornichon homolog 4 [Onthophagus taurus]|uniref:protein cornichon homolog 4 n=1 Tax=Onthophagus taurus TaxID=166361 RepID=UPI000C2057E5|nr:protein cornichon homolog 4 [Onthophagus taurus]
MVSDPFVFALALINTGALLFLWIYYIITISDLECDYLNAQQCCSKLNFWVTPKLCFHSGMVFLLLITGHWILVIFNMPLTAHMIYEIMKVPKGNIGVYEPTEIYFHGRIKRYMRDCMINLGYYLVLFFTYLYSMITAILNENPIIKDDDANIEF